MNENENDIIGIELFNVNIDEFVNLSDDDLDYLLGYDDVVFENNINNNINDNVE